MVTEFEDNGIFYRHAGYYNYSVGREVSNSGDLSSSLRVGNFDIWTDVGIVRLHVYPL